MKKSTKSQCAAKNQTGKKCAIYKKTHTNAKALANHIKKIKDRGGSFRKKKQGKSTVLEYSFS